MMQNKPKNRVVAVVVTYNRLELLKKCVASLQEQTAPCDVLIVDNASTDETSQWLKLQTSIAFRNTGSNLGGAGGFNYGMRWAVEAGYDYVWVMDDDTLPKTNALERLLDADEILKGNYGWLSSVALWTDGSECRMNRQKLKKNNCEYGSLLKDGLVQAEQATFVSLFLPAEKICRFGLPIKEFFLWGDDIEYTRRIAVRGNMMGYVVRSSQVVHATRNNMGSNVARDSIERVERYFYSFRNEVYLYRQEGFKGRMHCAVKRCQDFFRIVCYGKPKGIRFRVLFCGIRAGWSFSPEVEYLEKYTKRKLTENMEKQGN